MDLSNVAIVALEAARLEDSLIFYGSEELGTVGLLNGEGVNSLDLTEWDELEGTASDIRNAVTTLDEAGFQGQYNLALAPKRFKMM